MSGLFWKSAPPPPPPQPSPDLATLIMYAIFGWILIRILQSIPDKKKRRRKEKENEMPDKLSNVIGLEDVKEEIKYYMDFINNEEKYTKWGVKLPKGILLAGPPGTGKTLLVKTMADVLDIPVITAAGSSFVEMYVGVGAARVRKLFEKAKKKGKCIVFIDELDAVGSKRDNGGNSERASTLNQLLVEMDGFDNSDGIIIFAATNLINCLDPALLRSGRFDKKIFFDIPNFAERKSMFNLYLKDVKIPQTISDSVLSERTAGMTGADIANIANQSKINAIQRGQTNVELVESDIQIAIDEVMIGKEKRSRMLGEEERKRVAYHEAGHALMGYILKHSEPPIKVSIIPRGESALGFSQPKPVNKKIYTRNAILAQICVLLGGRGAEKLIYEEVSTGASDDIEKISNFVRRFNTNWGMSKEFGALNPDFMGIISESMSENVFASCKAMMDKLDEFTVDTLKTNKTHMMKIADDLLLNETIVYSRIKEILPEELENSIVCEF